MIKFLKYFLPHKDIDGNKNKYLVIFYNVINYLAKYPFRLISKNISYYSANKILCYALNNSEFKQIKLTKEFNQREDLWNYCVEFYKLKNKKICFIEFGVHEGNSIKIFASLFKNKKSKIFGFDTFTGMPENWHKIKKGTWSIKGGFPKINDKRVKFVKGLFQNTLPKYVNHFKKLEEKGYEFYIHNDSDLYSSTLFVLNQLSFLNKFYVFFDEFSSDENRALKNFVEMNFYFKVNFFAHTKGFANEPHRVFCKISKK